MISAEIREHFVTQAGDCAVILATNFDGADLSASMNRRLHVFASRFDPFHRFAKLDRDPTEQSFFRVNIQLRTKASADLGCNNAQLVFGNADHQSKLGSQEVRYL